MAIQNFGPDNASLTVRTARQGAAAKAGHDLLIEVGSWNATLDPEGQPALTLSADSRSLRVLEGTGGIKALTEDDKADIAKTINEEVLKGCAIEFRSSEVQRTPSGLSVRGELTLNGKQGPATFELTAGDDGHLTGSTTVTQTEFGMKPYRALFGALKLADEVQVAIDCRVDHSSL
jgi:YceI-like domain